MTAHYHGQDNTPCHLSDHRFIDERCVPLNCRDDHTPRRSPAERHYTARQDLREALDAPVQEQPTIDRLWAEYADALTEWLDDQGRHGAVTPDPEYDDLEARTSDALIGYRHE